MGIYPRVDRKRSSVDLRNYFIFNSELAGIVTPKKISENVHSRFVREAIVEKKLLNQTILYDMMIDKSPHYNSIHLDGRIQRTYIDNIEKIELYYQRLLRLYNSIKQYGLKRGEGLDYEIGIAIDADGDLYHFRTGHHRLAVAKALNITQLPVSIQLISAKYLRRFEENITQRNVKDVVRRAIRSTPIGVEDGNL